jgi:predicted Zn-dependent protease
MGGGPRAGGASVRAATGSRIALAALTAAGLACATSPTGRSQLIMFPDSEMAAMGVAAYDKLKTEMPVSDDAARQRYVRCVANAITAELKPGEGGGAWEVTLFEEPSANAFALPGRKIGVHTGLLEVATTQDQLAAVVGHEVAHVLARHSNERVSTQYAAQTGLELAGTIAGGSGGASQELMGLLGVGAQVGVILPFSRAQESEADQIGVELMARAGFDPAQSIKLWENMAASGGAAPPELLSTHPSSTSRIDKLRAEVPKVMPIYEQARAAGLKPACR